MLTNDVVSFEQLGHGVMKLYALLKAVIDYTGYYKRVCFVSFAAFVEF